MHGLTNWTALQGAESLIDGTKARRPMGDVNVKQMSMGSWKASLSNGGQASGLTGKVFAEKRKSAGPIIRKSERRDAR